ncbi:hypothetical protein CS542_06105 [Pedobacter sp. IW39]|nr:hypothetical protein CS542_06105 [Pedobacter sp. IW39]
MNDAGNDVYGQGKVVTKYRKSTSADCNDFALLNYAAYAGTGLKSSKAFNSKLVFAFGLLLPSWFGNSL